MVYPIPTTHLTFFGAAKEVTGSCYRLSHRNINILIECGMRQGRDRLDYEPKGEFPFDSKSIHAVILSHAHLDHSGELPRLVAQGFTGPIYCTHGTLGLLRVLLADSCKLYLRDIEHENVRRIRADEPLVEPDYDENDVAKVLELCQPINYYKEFTIENAFSFKFHNAGHILGSAIVELKIIDDKSTRTLTFSGDLGNSDTVLMPVPDVISHSDYVMMEGTYGDRNHRSSESTINELKQIIKDAEKSGGNILIPAFAVGRTQELIFQLGKLYMEGLLNGWTVYLDSPMAKEVTEFYALSQEQFDPEDQKIMQQCQQSDLIEFLPSLSITESVEDSQAINEHKHHAIIIAGSGMCTGGRIRHHFKHRLWDPRNHVVFVGFQAQGTLGRILINGVKRVKLFGHYIAVKAKIHTLGGFSAHADQQQLLNWAGQFKNKPPFFLIHGEINSLATLQSVLRQKLDIESEIPPKGSTLYL